LKSVSFVLTASSLQVLQHGLFYVQDELLQANLPVTILMSHATSKSNGKNRTIYLPAGP